MPDGYRNIYKTSRSAAGYTQEAAAERLGVSVESLRAYETGQRVPPNEVVELMVILYNASYLAYQHLRESNILFERVVPRVEDRGLMEVAVRIYNRMRHFAERHTVDRLLEMAEDNVIDEDEQAEFLSIVTELREIIQSGLELQAHCDGLPLRKNDNKGA